MGPFGNPPGVKNSDGWYEKERDRLHLIRHTQSQLLSQRAAAERLGVGVRWLKRLVRRWKQQGDVGFVSRQPVRPSNNRLGGDKRRALLCLLENKYAEFGPALATENLVEHEQIAVSRETIRRMQLAHTLLAVAEAPTKACVHATRAAPAVRRDDPDLRRPACLLRSPRTQAAR